MGKLVEHLKSEGTSEEEIREQRQVQIWSPARHAKQVLCCRWPVATTAEEQTIIDFVTPVLKCYPVGHEFKGDNIYWDSKTRPEKHLKSFIMLNRCLAAANYRCIQALPLRRSWVYAHVPLNTEILAQHIFEEEYIPVTDKLPATSAGKPKRYTQEGYWEQVVDMKLKSFKDHARHMFTGYVMTDGVSISVIRKNKEKLAAKVANQKRKCEEQAQQEQPAAQRARLAAQPVPPSYQPPSFQPVQQMPQQMSMSSQYMRLPSQQMPQQMSIPSQYARLPLQQMPQQMSILPSQQMSQYVWPLLQQEQQPWIRVVQQAQEVWEAQQVRLSAEQAEQECLMAKQALCVLQAQLSAEQPQLPAQKAKQRRPAQPQQKADCAYIDDLPQVQLQSTAGRCVLIDPGRRDLLFVMHEDSSIEEKSVPVHPEPATQGDAADQV
ncbi:hypothetical protein IWW56_002600 [Coemansia sp. RSA 2131]|nr:hypothetical protein IWW56_002600 [Coemansia sp. RSA 2131]